ncbi:hypothetical protein [Streptomyces sp. NPDC090798]|uniref:hypothetical protein n=1 Tax=Streptomyces sp. NPDC090798 TaxID=3365968 RepID=UPI0038036915
MAGDIAPAIYGITPEGELRWYRHDGWTDGTVRWTTGEGGNLVGTGWNVYSTVFGSSAHSLARRHAVMPSSVIYYRIRRLDADGVLREHEGEALATDTPVPIGALNIPGESFSYRYSFVDETGALRARTGEIAATTEGRIQVATVTINGSVDGKTLTAKGHAEIVTGSVDASASVDAPGVSGGAMGHAEGPSVHASGEIGTDGAGVEFGASVGKLGGQVQITIGGQTYGTGGEIGLKAELGIEWGPTSTLKLPLITISGPNPMAGVTSFAASAVKDFARDPLRTSEKTISDIVDAGKDAVETAGQVFETAKEVIHSVEHLFEVDDDDRNIVTTDQQQGPHPRKLPPGAVNLD